MNVSTLIHAIGEQAGKNPVLLIALLLGLGSLLGAVRIKNVGLGPAAVLFLAIAFSAANRSFSSYCYLTFRDVPPVTGAGCRWLLGR